MSSSSSSPPSSFRRQLLLDDCRELHRKGFLTDDQLFDYETRLVLLPELIDNNKDTKRGSNGTTACATVKDPKVELYMVQIRALYQHELDTIIDKIRAQHNEKKQDTFVTSDFVAIATGSVFGALNAWMKPAATVATPVPAQPSAAAAATSLWASAFDAAQASLNVVRKSRLLEHLQIKHLSGDEATCDHIVLCINGFMTQGADPTRNWSAWFGEKVVVYAVLWEAGDIEAWNDFCAHVNDQISSSTVGAATSALITHFTGNPWHKAQDQASQVGALLAQVLASQPTFCRGRKVTLFGHSLGGAVIYSTFQEIARLRSSEYQQENHKQDQQDGDSSRIHIPAVPLITNAVCFAGAFIPSATGLEIIANELPPSGKFINVYSKRDSVLSKLFWALQLHASDPIAAGCAAIKFPPVGLRNCVNVDVSDLIPPRITNQFGHGYGPHMDSILLRVCPHLSSIYN